MAFVEDRQLLELSRSPKRSLFPVLNRAESMSPLIVLLALLPPLYVLVHRTLSPLDAMWGLKAVRIAAADSAEVWFDPASAGGGAEEIPLKWQPPLSSWLTAGVMSLTGTERPLALVLSSFLATAGLVVCVFGLADRLRGPQFAWWTTCLVAMHGPILLGAQTPAPVSLTLATAAAACWGFIVHCQDHKRLFSLPLLWGGIAWGLCLLAAGPPALVMLAVFLLYVLSLSQDSKTSKKTSLKSRRVWKGKPALQSLGLMVLIGLVVGGWWEVWMFARYQFEFLWEWIAGASTLPDVPSEEVPLGRQLVRDISQMGGALVGLTVLGLGLGVWMLSDPDHRSERSSLTLMLAWLVCGGIVWVCLRAGSSRPDAFTAVWRGFCLVPATMLAAFAIEHIVFRRIGYFGMLFGLCLTLCVLLLVPPEVGFGLVGPGERLWPSLLPVLRGFSPSEAPWLLAWFWRLLLLFAVSALVCWGLWRTVGRNDFRQRVFLDVSLGLVILLHAMIGFAGVRQSTLSDRAAAHLRSELSEVPGVARWTILSPEQSPLALRFLLKSIWPRVDSQELDSWWDPQLTRDLAQGDPPDGIHVVIDYNTRDTRTPTLRFSDTAGNSHFVDFTSIGTPQILWNGRLRTYELTDRLISR